MMKRITILIILISLSLHIFSQSFQINWQSCFGGTEKDYAVDILELDNGFFILGNTLSNDGDISFSHGEADAWIIKTDINGNMIWEKTYGGSQGDGCRRIIPDTYGNYYLLGASISSDGDISYDPYTDSWDFWIVKIDSAGTILWDKIVGGNADETLWTGTVTDDGGIVALGWTTSDDGDVTTYYGLCDVWLVKLNSDGEKEWDFTIGTDWQDYGQAIIQTSDGGFLVGCASAIGEGGNLTCVPFNSCAEAILVKLDAGRNIEWQQCYGGSGHDGVTALIEVSDGYIVGAYVNSNDGDISGWHGESDIWIVKTDFLGNILWQKCLGGSRSDYVSKLIITDEEEIIIPGNTQSNDGDVSGNHTLSEYDHDIWMVKLSGYGELISQQCIGGTGDERVNFGVIRKSDYNFVIAGQTNWGPSYDVTCTPHPSSAGWPDYWVFEIKDTTVNVNENKVHESGIKVYPNPAKDYVVFEVPGISGKNSGKGILNELNSIQITNMFGLKVENNLPIKDEIAVWDCRGVKAGIYFYKIKLENRIQCGKLIIQ